MARDEDMFRDVDELTENTDYEDSEEFYPKRKSAAELQLEEELRRDTEELDKQENKQSNKKDDKMEDKKELEKQDSNKQTSEQKAPASKKADEDKKDTVAKQNDKTKPKKDDDEKSGSKTAETQKSTLQTEESKDKKSGAKKTKKPAKEKTKKDKSSKAGKEEPKVEIIDEPGNKWIAVMAASILIIAIVVALYFAFSPTPEENNENEVIAAIVNGQPIYESDVDFRTQSLQGIGFSGVPRDTVLNQLIEEELIKQDAKERNIDVSIAEAEDALEERLKESGMTLEDFRKDVERNGYTYEQMIQFYRAQAIITKYMEETFNETTVTEEETESYYDENKEEFTIDELITVRHLLLMFENKSQNETLKEAEDIMNLLETEDFCDLVTEHSDDTATVENCGELQYSREANIVPEFKEATFNMDVNETRMVKTSFGYHIVEKLDSEKNSIRDISEVREEIEQYLKSKKEADAYEERVEQLKENSIIEIYTDGEQIENSEQKAEAQAVNDSEQIPDTDTQKTENSEDTKKTKEVILTAQSRIKELATCLNKNGAKMYTVYWAPDNEVQLDYFEEYQDLISVIECDPESEEYDQACEGKDFKAYPAWEIDGEKYPGVQSLRKLSEITGCTY